MSLLDLPPELIALIAQHIGISELRKTVAYLLVAKRWYHAVLPVYLSWLPLSDLYLASHHDLESLPPAGTALSRLIQAQTKRLSVRIVGHPCKCPSLAPWHDNTEIERGNDGMKKWEDWHCDWITFGPVRTLVGYKYAWRWHEETRILHRWAGRINKKLVELAAMLPDIKNLDEFSFEAASEHDGEQGPRWDYLHDSTVCSLLSSLPPFLNKLTIDMCGSRAITQDRVSDPVHLCPLLGDRLRDLQDVRLRLRYICPQIFQTSSTNSSTKPRLKTLVIKLCLPHFPNSIDENYNGLDMFDARPCDVRAVPLYKRIIAAGAKSTKNLPSLSMMRISFRHNVKNNTCLYVADCVRKRCMFEGSEVFCYEDDGSLWDAWENSESLQDLGSLQELLR